VRGAATVILAMGDGKRVAATIDHDLDAVSVEVATRSRG
jgi:NADPH-dependent glutamate synthase beta subunit-like oxidoreductase